MTLSNQYYLMRHGQSEANVAGIIVSAPKLGCTHFGLTCEGKKQVINSLPTCKELKIQSVYCSDFLRTKQTAQLLTDNLSLSEPVIEPLLRERFFGEWDGLSDRYYDTVWQHDALGTSGSTHRVETTDQVFKRAMLVIARLEESHRNENILLVAHGDVLQILRTAWFKLAPYQHRQLPNINTGEIIPLIHA